jgi:hypothetical protein
MNLREQGVSGSEFPVPELNRPVGAEQASRLFYFRRIGSFHRGWRTSRSKYPHRSQDPPRKLPQRGCVSKPGTWNSLSMLEMAHPGENHRHLSLICRGNHSFVPDRAARLNDSARAGVSRRNYPVGEREKRIAAHGASIE